MASALLAAASPENAPFMADECLMAIPEIEGIDYTTKEYLNFVQHIQNTVDRLNKQSKCLLLHIFFHRFRLYDDTAEIRFENESVCRQSMIIVVRRELFANLKILC